MTGLDKLFLITFRGEPFLLKKSLLRGSLRKGGGEAAAEKANRRRGTIHKPIESQGHHRYEPGMNRKKMKGRTELAQKVSRKLHEVWHRLILYGLRFALRVKEKDKGLCSPPSRRGGTES